jgi:two-component system, NarL family, response regulator NreC
VETLANQRSLRILIVDDHELMRAGVRTIVSHNSLWEICGEAENGREAIDKTQELKPDLVVIDISMPQMNGIDATREIRRIAPGTKIIILTMHENRQIVFAAQHAGADAVITKRMASESLINAIERLFDVTASELVEDSKNF